jgi:hypothetical protein
MLVSLKQAKDHLRVRADEHADDDDLILKIQGASSAVVNYLKSAANTFLNTDGEIETDANGDPVGVPFAVSAATLLMLGFLYKDRDDNADNAYEQGYLPKPVTALLYPLRDPACA